MKSFAFGSSAALLLALAILAIPALTPSSAGAEAAASPAPGNAAASIPRSGRPELAARAPHAPEPEPPATGAIAELLEAQGLRAEVLRVALEAKAEAERRGLVERPEILTVIDYSLPSTEKRLWVLDLDRGEVLFHELVSHGKGSGGNRATRFSNVSMSLKSSLGLMTTAETYYGKNGYSLRLDGHEVGFNDQARPRAIVIHGADYATPAFVSRIGRLGRSWGCPALDPKVARRVIDTIKGGSVVFGYYPNETYLSKSAFVDPDAGRSALRLASAPAP